MISPCKAAKHIKDRGIEYGRNVTLPITIDTTNCDEFVGTRCPCNVHVTGSRRAHIDREDPRKNPLGHLKNDVRIPYIVITIPAGAAIGAIVSKNDRKMGAAVGALAGFAIGLIADLASS